MTLHLFQGPRCLHSLQGDKVGGGQETLLSVWYFTETRSKGQSQKAFLQGHCARQRHSESGRLCCVPLSWTP